MLKEITTLCSKDCGCCPTISIDDSAEELKSVVIKDDFGGTTQMSREQFRDLVSKAKSGSLDQI